MEAANRGAHEAGGASYGLNIILPHEQKENPYVEKSIEFQYFFTRKVCLVKYPARSSRRAGWAPDELFEAATRIQCGRSARSTTMGAKFWNGLREWGQAMMKEGVFARDEIGFGYVTDSPKEAVDLILRSQPAAVRARLEPCE
jgi:predicted Rossmann-fold nucleotide-binding protein